MVISVSIFIILCFGSISTERKFRNAPIATSIKSGVNFDCPEEFGYYPHPSDCTQYYVCVFGGALLESCTGGLMYSHELQTCDWPRNVGCDGVDAAAPASGSSASYSSYSPPVRNKERGREREKVREDTRTRYSPPPPPPPPAQPAAVVTSRGQPRNLQQTQQEIIKRKQQQQLYAEADETLPPAEEIENDRQQRVYRGQPSTIGQVQRDRDGLRHSNAISTYSGRGEKIGVISFGTQNQHYRLMSDNDLLLKHMTTKRRQKRQIRKSRPPEITHHIRRQGTEKNNLGFIQFQPLTERPFHKKRFTFNPSAPINNNNNEEEFQPFTPSYQTSGNNYQYIAFGKWADLPHRTSTIKYRNTYSTSTPPISRKRNRHPIKYNPSSLVMDYSQIEQYKAPNKTQNLQTQAIVAPYTINQGVKYVFNKTQNKSNRTNQQESQNLESPSEYINSEASYVNIRNLFADPDFDFEAFMKNFQDFTATSTEFPKINKTTSIYNISTSINNQTNISSNLIDFLVEENRIKENERNNHKNNDTVPVLKTNTTKDKLNVDEYQLTSSSNNSKHGGTNKISTKVTDMKYNLKNRPFVKMNKLNESDSDYYYYYDGYEDELYPDKTNFNKNNDYIYYYDNEYFYPDLDLVKKKPAIDQTNNETVKINQLYSSSTTVNPLSSTKLPSTITNKHVQEISTTPKSRRTTRRLPNRATRRPTVKKHGDILKSGQTTTQTYENYTKTRHWNNSQSEEKNVSPQQASVSTVTAPSRNIYNGSQYNDNRYEPYYALYDDDVEIYRDEYPANENTYSNEHSPSTAYRGTAPVSTVTPASIRNEIPRRGSTVYIENNINPQDIYQQSTASDYATNNKFETQDDQNSYKQNNRQQSYRGDRNELNDVEEVTTKRSTKRTTTTTRKPTTTTRVTTTTTVPTQKSSQLPQSRPQTSYQNQSIAETLVNTVSRETQSYDTYEPYPPSTYLNVPDVNNTENITFVILNNHDSQYVSSNSPNKLNVDNEPLSTTIKIKPSFHYITKTTTSPSTTSTTTITTTTTTTTTSAPDKKNLTRSNSFNKLPSFPQNIIPTTYSPFRFVLKTPNSKPIFVETTPITNNWRSSESGSLTYQNTNNNNLKAYKALKAVRKVLNPVNLNHELSSPAEKIKDQPTEHQEDDDKQMYKLKYFVSDHRISNEKFVPTNQNNKQRKTSSTTTTTTEVTTSEVSTKKGLEEDNSEEDFDENVDTIQTEVASTEDYPVDVRSTVKPESDKYSKQEPKPFSKPVITTTTKTNFLQNDSLPTRTSRVNAAIKSLINLGETRGSNKNKEGLIFPSKNFSKQRTPARGRGSVQYSGAGDQITNNEVIVTNNRGTPPTRSRPTLKPSTSIVSKAQEFVDIYKYPPRRPDPIYPQPQVDKTAAKCRKDVCLLPDCSCGGKEIPGDLPVEQLPQIILMTFDDSVNDLNKGLYQDLFEKGRTNPNGCPIAATFYVSHEWTDYSQVQNLYADGHELASHTVSHSFGEQFSQKKWTREVAGQREILAAYGGVHLEDVRGMRAPFLSVGGNKMFKMLYDSNFTYDSSMPIYENKPPSYPYTLDYKLFHDCMIPPCPTRSYPGVWEVPMVMWQDLNGGRCSMGDACSNPPDADGVFKMLMKNFMRHYTTNRAPFGLFYHAAWFTQPHHKEGFINFVDTVLAKNDVWFLTNWQAIQWVRDPTPTSRLNSFQPFQCNYADRPKRCNNPKVCNLWHKSGVRYMRTCQPCPDIYPWTGNSGIRSSKIDNDIGD